MSLKKYPSRNEKPGNCDVWHSILTQKTNDETSDLTAPYINPLVKKRPESCFLSEKSLEICTESLGSETGSDGYFSFSYAPFEKAEDSEENDEKHKKKKSLPRCFPPPLPSLLSSSQHGGPSLHMIRVPNRDNGRLFLKAVSIVSYNNFLAKRQDGRLVLTFASDEEDQQEEDVDEGLMEQEPMLLSSGIIAKRGLLKAYDQCYWRKVVVTGKDDSWNIIMNINEETSASSDESQEMLVVRGKKCCKDFRGSFLFREEHYCSSTIATTS